MAAKRYPHTPRYLTPGQRVIGNRCPNKEPGTFVSGYYTINSNRGGTWRNYSYIVKCDKDGKERSFQSVHAVE
jgi:hypothetical protein